MIFVQIIVFIFIGFAWSRAVIQFRSRRISVGEFLFWTLVWGGFNVLVFFPGLLSSIAELIGIGRGVDVIIYSSIVMIFYLIFRIYIKLEETQREITELVRKIAINEKRKK